MTPEQELKQRQIDQRFSVKDRIEVLRWIMENPLGRKFIWWLLAEAKIFSSTLNDHHVMAFDTGLKQMGLKIFNLIQADEGCWELFAKARREHNQNRTEVK